MSNNKLEKFIRSNAKNLGFNHIGITSATKDIVSSQRLHEWLNNNYHASMLWMEKNVSKRDNIKNYFPQAKSVISLTMNYFTGNAESKNEFGKISNYAWGDDYHNIMKPKLYQLLTNITSKHNNIKGIVCVDTAPIMEKVWAQKAGIGWIGKHTNLITQDYGSWIFLGEIILNIELDYDNPFIEDLCGTCTACLDACPTNAFPEPYILDSSKCISYLTIEHRGSFNEKNHNKLSGWIYGCDICQEVCPWNIKFSQKTKNHAFQARSNLINRKLKDWIDLSEFEYRNLFKNSAIKRTKYKGLIRNINANL